MGFRWARRGSARNEWVRSCRAVSGRARSGSADPSKESSNIRVVKNDFVFMGGGIRFIVCLRVGLSCGINRFI